MNTYGLSNPVVREDVLCITAEYLINNIELAFKVWRETPWGKHIPFDTFCEEILPYRVANEPLENWREKVLTGFADLYDELKNDASMTAVTACCRVNALLPWFRMDKDFPSMNYSTLMASSRNTCSGMTALAIFSMRAMGIPVTYDYTIQYPRSYMGHSWNSVSDSVGNHISFMGTESAPGRGHQGSDTPTSKVYRKMFALQNPIRTEKKHIPPVFNDHRSMMDISHEYAGHTNIEVSVDFPPVVHTGYAYLATLIFGADGLRWNPVAWGTVENQSIRFNLIGKKILYLPVYYANHRQTSAGYPFFIDRARNVQYFKPDTASCREHVFHECGTPSSKGEPARIVSKTAYELLYWNGTDWLSLGKRIATNASVSFCVPDNALFYIRAIGGIDNSFPVFHIRNGKQHWLFKESKYHD
jgi:hypothetical protein